MLTHLCLFFFLNGVIAGYGLLTVLLSSASGECVLFSFLE